MEQLKTQRDLDRDIYNAVREHCGMQCSSIEVDKALGTFESVLRHASPREVRMHKSEYVLLFSRAVFAAKHQKSTHGTTPKYDPKMVRQIVKLTDWFFLKKESGEASYKQRLQKLAQLLKDKKIPVSQKKYQDWEHLLQPKRPRTDSKVNLDGPAEVYHLAFLGHRVGKRNS